MSVFDRFFTDFYRLFYNDVDKFSGNCDYFHRRFSFHQILNALLPQSQLLEFRSGNFGGNGQLVANLAINLDHYFHRIGFQRFRIPFGPGLSVYAVRMSGQAPEFFRDIKLPACL